VERWRELQQQSKSQKISSTLFEREKKMGVVADAFAMGKKTKIMEDTWGHLRKLGTFKGKARVAISDDGETITQDTLEEVHNPWDFPVFCAFVLKQAEGKNEGEVWDFTIEMTAQIKTIPWTDDELEQFQYELEEFNEPIPEPKQDEFVTYKVLKEECVLKGMK